MLLKKRSLTSVAMLAVAFSFGGCFFGDNEDQDYERVRDGLDEAAQGLEEAAEGLADALGDMAEELASGGQVDNPISFRDFYDFVPDRMGDFERTSREGKTEGALGFEVSMVEADYEDEDGGRIEMAIVDLGAIPISVGNFVDWLDIEVDEESDRGWKRTSEYEGYPAMEEFRFRDGEHGTGDFVFFVEERFLVALEGRNVTAEDLSDFRDRIDVDDLADWKDREGDSDDDRRRRDRDR